MKSPHRTRELRFQDLSDGDPLDVLVVGGGMTGAPLYHELCRRGYRVALIDKGDFSSGTSQASGMLIWGGLLYLKNLDFPTVLKLCKARKELLSGFPDEVSTLDLQFLFSPDSRRSPATVWWILQLYWLMGGCALKRPFRMKSAAPHGLPALGYQEAMLRESDSRFVIDRIRAFDSEHCIPINHCRLADAEFDPQQGCWTANLRDEAGGSEHSIKTRMIINAAGVWADQLNRLLGVESPYKHVFSKGVYLSLPRSAEQTAAQVYPMHGKDDVITQVPWGPVMMWGPTETAVRDLESGLTPDRDDVRFLIDHANRSLGRKIGVEDVISVRCGIRPLAVPRNDSRDIYPLDLSRRHRVVLHKQKRAISLYGGKITSSLKVAEHVADLIGRWQRPRHGPRETCCPPAERSMHPELNHEFVTAEWARDHEFCLNLEDYLRRRTCIAQWTRRMGFGGNGCGREALLKLAETFAHDPAEACGMVNAYEQKVRNTYDPLLAV
jgi:glycerol-3-phosphate dehydrogenase